MRFGFIGPAYTGRAKTSDAEQAINLYLEHVEGPKAKVPVAMIRTPGLKLFGSVANATSGRGIYREPATQRCFCVIDATFYEVLANGTLTNWGPVDNSVVPASAVSFRSNGLTVVIASNTFGYAFTLATNTFAQINLANFPNVNPTTQPGASGFAGAVQFEFLDAYLIALQPNSRTIGVSLLNDATDWSALSWQTKETWPDNIVGMSMDQQRLWLFGTERSEPWYDAGTYPFPLDRENGVSIETGCASWSSIARGDNGIFWLGSDERGQGIVYRTTNGSQAQRISNHALEYQIAQYATIADARGWVEQREGHTFYWLWFPSGDATWVYDVATNSWHQRAYWDAAGGTGYHAHLASGHAFAFGLHLVCDRQSGNLYVLDANTHTDNGAALRWLRSCPVFAEQKWLYFKQLVLYMVFGQALQVGQGSNPQVCLRISDDGGFTWGPEWWQPMGANGVFNWRILWRGLGRSRDRVFEVSGSEPIATSLVESFLEAQKGSGA